MAKGKKINSAILIIGDEILSGRTQDLNVSFLANWLNKNCGISVGEVRVIPDKEKLQLADDISILSSISLTCNKVPAPV